MIMRQTGKGGVELVIALPHGGSVTDRFNYYLVIEHPTICCVCCVNTLQVDFWNHARPLTLILTLILTLTLTLHPPRA